MYIINKLEFEKVNKEWQHKSTRLIRTFPEESEAVKYLENCIKLATYSNKKEKYNLVNLGV